jgi:nucleotide-binding universal stress UspA family protein
MYQRILVPADGSATATKGLDEAIKLAKLTGANLRLIHLVDELSFATGFETCAAYTGEVIPLMKELGARVLEQGNARAEAGGVPVDIRLIETVAARVAEVVVEQARAMGADLIVIGTHGRRGVGRLFLGSDAEQILRLAPVPVLLVRAREAGGKTDAA